MEPAQPLPPQADRRKAILAYVWLFLGYVAYYLCRSNFAVAYEPMRQAGILDANSYGWIASLGTLIYAAGKLVTGTWADRFGGKRVFLAGMVCSAAVTAPMGLSPYVILIAVLWSLNRWFQSAGWAGLVKVAVGWSTPQRYGTDMGLLAVSYQVGGAVAAAFAGLLLSLGLGWRFLFFLPALVLGAFALVVRWQLKEAPAAAPVEIKAAETVEKAPIVTLLARPAFLVACSLSFVLTLVRECFNTWLPAYFGALGAKADAAAFKSIIFPLVGAVGTLVLGWVSDNVRGLSRGRIMAIALAIGALGLFGLAELPWVASVTGLPPSGAASALVGVVGFFLLGAYAIVAGGALALDFGGKAASATAAGALDAVGYLGGTLSGIGVASLVDRAGWNVTFGMLAAGAAGCVLLSLWIDHLSRKT